MTSPLSRISAGSFFNGYRLEYSSWGVPGTTVVGTNSILSIRPSSIAAMRTLRANGEAGEKVSFIGMFLKRYALAGNYPSLRANGSRECAPDGRLREAIQSQKTSTDCFVATLPAMESGWRPQA